jgi:hypothetical protein
MVTASVGALGSGGARGQVPGQLASVSPCHGLPGNRVTIVA